jgi:hypothetical protein
MKSLFNHSVACIATGAVILLASCSKEDFNVPQSLQTREKTENHEPAPLFGNDFLVPFEAARLLASNMRNLNRDPFDDKSSEKTLKIKNGHIIRDINGMNVLYVFNFESGGFTVISADERHDPICAVTPRGSYEKTEVPSALLRWFDVTMENIRLLRVGEINNTLPARKEWIRLMRKTGSEELLPNLSCCPECPNYPDCLKNREMGCGEPDIYCQDDNGSNDDDEDDGSDDPCGPFVTASKGPLLKTTWGQICSYNEACPQFSCQNPCTPNQSAVTGCVATSMAQIIRFWNAPTSHQYDYTTMPNQYGNSEVQRLMRDAGVSVATNYGCNGSGAMASNLPGAFVGTFGFNSATRNSYGSGSYQTIIQNINSGRPVVLDACSVRKPWIFGLFYTVHDCHAWVCDGYASVKNNCYFNLKLHMNWGWDGYYDGWYAYNNWNPGNINFQYARDITHNISL